MDIYKIEICGIRVLKFDIKGLAEKYTVFHIFIAYSRTAFTYKWSIPFNMISMETGDQTAHKRFSWPEAKHTALV